MKPIFTLLSVCLLHSSWATNYYFSSTFGNDSRTSTQARSSSTPWKSLNKLNSFFSSLQPGDSVLFKRGETFYGSIVVNKSGTSGRPIVIGAYGSGSKPIITSLVTLSGWTANSSYKGVFDCSSNSALPPQVNMVLLNDNQKAIGRYPNANAVNGGYLTLESHSGKTSITDKELTSSPNWKGAELVLRTSHWTIERCKITSHSGSTIYYTANEGAYEAHDKYGYFIQNHLKTLDQLGEWSYNPSTKKISMFFGSASPSSYSVKASTINNLVYSSGKSYIVFYNVALKGANENGFEIKSGSYITVKNCDVIYSGVNGVEASGSSNFKCENSNVLTSNNNGVTASGCDNAGIRNNIIKNSYTIAGMGQSGNGKGAGIRLGSNSIAEYNQVIKSGYVAIHFSGNNLTIKNNYLDTFTYVKDDAAAIYTSNGVDATNYGRKITGNIILHGLGAPGGTDTKNSSADGIYMDDNVNGCEITGNTIAHCNRGIYLHNSRNIIVRNNTIFDNKNGQVQMKYDGIGGLLRNHTVTNNIFFSKYAADLATTIYTKKDDYDITQFGRLDSNYYARPQNNTNLIQTATYLWTSKMVKTDRDLPEWKSKYNKDKVSKLSIKTFTGDPNDHIKFVYNATQETKTISLYGTYVDAKNIKYSSIVLKPYTSAVLIKDGTSTSPDNLAPTVSITSPSDNSVYKAPATINISAVASDDDGSVSKVDFYSGTKLLHTELNAPYSWDWKSVPAGTYSITAKATDNKGKTTTSAIVKVSVGSSTGNTAPAVSITTPVTNTSYNAPATINMIASATDRDGTIKRVEFYNGSRLLHTEYNGTYSYSWTNVAAGTYTITAKATDNDGATTTSAAVKVTVVSKSYRSSGNSNTSSASNTDSTLSSAAIADKASLKNADFKLFPNPAVSSIYLNFDGVLINERATLTIQNALGSILKRYPVVISGKSLQADISSLNTGMFIITLAGDGFSINKRFIKNK